MCQFADHFLMFFVVFSGGSEPRSARAGAVQPQFFIFEAASEQTQFFLDFYVNFRVTSGISGFEFDKKDVKIRP